MRQLNEVTTINRKQQQRVKYNQTDGFNPKTSPENQKAITINNSVTRNIQMKEESCKQDVSWLKNADTINSSPGIMPLAALYFGVLFFGGISPSKIGQIAPFLATIQALSKARVFLSI
jgi:hypothetical protein